MNEKSKTKGTFCTKKNLAQQVKVILQHQFEGVSTLPVVHPHIKYSVHTIVARTHSLSVQHRL